MKVLKLHVNMPEDLKFKFQNKCDYYELNQSNVVCFLIEKFLENKYDEELDINKVSQ